VTDVPADGAGVPAPEGRGTSLGADDHAGAGTEPGAGPGGGAETGTPVGAASDAGTESAAGAVEEPADVRAELEDLAQDLNRTALGTTGQRIRVLVLLVILVLAVSFSLMLLRTQGPGGWLASPSPTSWTAVHVA
jgi:hypothetical protein